MEDRASQEVSVVKNLPASAGDAIDAVSIPRSGRFLGVGIGVSQVSPHSSILAWRIPWA